MMEYLSTAKVGGDPNAVSEVLHRDPFAMVWRKRIFWQRAG
jgi:hypothetical protein